MFISDKIGEDYKNWKDGDNILIPAPTGSGKTTFVINHLLKNAAEAGKNLIYICNRKILNEQVSQRQKEIKEGLSEKGYNIPKEYGDYFHIVTYQYCETHGYFPKFSFEPGLSGMTRREIADCKLRHTLPDPIDVNAEDIMYYVFDEAHYFLCDSLFNSNTNYWYDKYWGYGIKVFLTATPQPLRLFIMAKHNKAIVPQSLKEFYEGFKEKSKQKGILETPERVIRVSLKKDLYDKVRDCAEDTTKHTPQRKIVETLRAIDPYRKQFDNLDRRLTGIPLVEVQCETPTDYSWMSFWYFWEYSEIIEKVGTASQEDKWLIFVDREEDGFRLEERLNVRGNGGNFAVFQSSKKIRKKDGQEMLDSISKNNKFTLPVLITTSVMDCGVSIHDRAVRHIVVAESQKFTFIQELGRKRRNNNESGIEVFIKGFRPQKINGKCCLLDKKMRFLATYRVRNDITFVSHGEATECNDGMHSNPVLPRKTTNQLIADLISTPNNNLVYHLYDYDPRGKYDHKSRELNKVLGEYSYSETAFLYISLLMYDYQQALEEYRETGDDAFYIRHQLAWLNQEYYKDRWVTYSACMADLMEFLNENEGLWMRKQEQDVFTRRCTTLLMRFPILPSKLKRNSSKYEKDESFSLGLKRLNECLIEMDIPYRIVSHQRGTDHKTQWKLEHK